MILRCNRLVRGLLALAFAAGAVAAHAEVKEGRDYRLISPAQPVETAGKIEVLEFFGYPCPHCYALEGPLETWVKKLPADVVFRRVPALFNEQYAQAGRVHYTLEAMGQLDRLHKPFFDAIHKDGLRIMNDAAVEEWVGKQKLNPAEFRKISRSFSIESRLRRAVAMMEAYRVESVPTIVVQGKYLALTKGPDAYLAAVDELIALARKDLKPAAAAAK